MNFKYLINFYFLSFLAISNIALAASSFLPPDQAFQFSAESISNQKAQLKWNIAPQYYLYHDQFKVSVNNQPIKLELPKGHEKDDPTFGRTFVHYNQVITHINLKPNTAYQVLWQGCAEDGLCYPMQRTTIHTDVDGLLPQHAASNQNLNTKSLFKTSTKNELVNDSNVVETQSTLTTSNKNNLKVDQATEDSDKKLIETKFPDQKSNVASNNIENNAVETDQKKSEITIDSTRNNIQESDKDSALSLQINNDKSFFQLLNKDTLFLNLLVFFGLGILLAFLPCSLPLIPILSGIIVQRATGYKAIAIALSFIFSMAVVYSIMGVVVAEIGYSFQRWFQSPIIVSIFALFFVALALSMFGLYQIALPQRLMQKLDMLQNKQKGGTFAGAVAMGALSALIVGPCMSAPLAGALLFVSQSQSGFLGGLYLFILGLGIGLPLFIASVFGSKYLPKPGLWMDRLKIGFGFIMLMLAVYFLRPMLPMFIYSLCMAILFIALAVYLFYIVPKGQNISYKVALSILAALCLGLSIWNIKESSSVFKVEQTESAHLNWIRVTSLDELKQAISQAKHDKKPIVVDVYADWCVACQPIEREVLPRKDVQNALNQFTLIKLDLTKYNASQDIILKEKQILGPPTVLFLNHLADEKRELRLTGTFAAKDLLSQLSKAGQN
nr:protein-disulfide reductase DsbD [Acinetobacter sp. Marseille-Q1620]